MACIRSIASRVSHLRRRYNGSVYYPLHFDDHNKDTSQKTINSYSSRSYFDLSYNSHGGLGSIFRGRRHFPSSFVSELGVVSWRYLSTAADGESSGIEYMHDIARSLPETTSDMIAAQAPAIEEVVLAAGDSFFPIAALQYLIGHIHSFTGLNWWASIALTTLLIRGATVPLIINQLKATSKLTLMRPRLEEIKQQIQDAGMDPIAMAESQKRMKQLFREYGVTPFTPLKGLLIQGPLFVCFFLAISNMAVKVPSFKTGGAFWFTDLTTPDDLYLLPLFTGLSFLITVECNAQEGLEGNPIAGTMKNFSRIVAVATIFFTQSFPKAVFCYWVTSNLFSLVYGLVIKRPEMKKILGLPEMPVPTPSASKQPAFSWSSLLQRSTAVASLSAQPEAPKPAERKKMSSAILNQRLRSLENQVKGRKKNKRK